MSQHGDSPLLRQTCSKIAKKTLPGPTNRGHVLFLNFVLCSQFKQFPLNQEECVLIFLQKHELRKLVIKIVDTRGKFSGEIIYHLL